MGYYSRFECKTELTEEQIEKLDELTDYYQWAQEAIEGTYEYQEDDSLFDWDGDALASAGFGTDEDYL